MPYNLPKVHIKCHKHFERWLLDKAGYFLPERVIQSSWCVNRCLTSLLICADVNPLDSLECLSFNKHNAYINNWKNVISSVFSLIIYFCGMDYWSNSEDQQNWKCTLVHEFLQKFTFYSQIKYGRKKPPISLKLETQSLLQIFHFCKPHKGTLRSFLVFVITWKTGLSGRKRCIIFKRQIQGLGESLG